MCHIVGHFFQVICGGNALVSVQLHHWVYGGTAFAKIAELIIGKNAFD